MEEKKTINEKNLECTINKPEPLLASFTPAELKVVLNGTLLDNITAIAVHENESLSNEDFYKTIPELNISDLGSAKNVKAVIIFEALIGSNIDVTASSEMELITSDGYGNMMGKRVHDVNLIKKSFKANSGVTTLVDQYVLVSSDVDGFKHIVVESK